MAPKWLADKDPQKYHLDPERTKYRVSVPVCVRNNKSRKEVWVYVPIMCRVHPFTYVRDCFWSVRMGRGYPYRSATMHINSYWSRIAERNQKWAKRGYYEDYKKYRAAEGDQTLYLKDGTRVRVWYPDPCTTCDTRQKKPCDCHGRRVLMQKVIGSGN